MQGRSPSSGGTGPSAALGWVLAPSTLPGGILTPWEAPGKAARKMGRVRRAGKLLRSLGPPMDALCFGECRFPFFMVLQKSIQRCSCRWFGSALCATQRIVKSLKRKGWKRSPRSSSPTFNSLLKNTVWSETSKRTRAVVDFLSFYFD